MTDTTEMSDRPSVELTNRPESRRAWFGDVNRHLDVLMVLARKDFQTRYKRASLGLSWAVLVPVLQGSVMAAVFSRVVKVSGGNGYTVYVMGGIFAFTYFSQTLPAAVTSIVDGASLTDKVWFPRVVLVVVPVLANLVGLLITFSFLIAFLGPLGGRYSWRLLLLLPALGLLILFTTALALVLSALHVYYRDVKFLVQAALMIWLYITPVIYPISLLHRLMPLAVANPLTGVVALVHEASLGSSRGALLVPVAVSLGVTVVLLLVGSEAQRRHDRLFVDLL